jgi:hypothetical protein
MQKDKLAWFKNNKTQIDWACKYLKNPKVIDKLVQISEFRPTNDHSTYKGIIATLSYLGSYEHGREFIRVMTNTWNKIQSDRKDSRKNLHIKVEQNTYKNLKLLTKDSEHNNSEIIELLINGQRDELNKVIKKHEKNIERLKRQHTKDILKINFKYESEDSVPKSIHDDVKHELTKTKDSLVKISETINQLK